MLATVILNTNRRDDLIEALHTVVGQAVPNHHVIVLDNHSQDGSAAAVEAQFPSVEVMALSDNRGYAGNNNVGISRALEIGADWILLLNEDVVVEAGALEALMDAAEADPQAGILGPLVLHHDEPTIIQSAGGTLDDRWLATHRAQNQPDSGQMDSVEEVDWISGCAIMARREVIEQVGQLDERFFYYWEETEWCVRARRAGWKILFVPAARIWHKGVQRDYSPGPSVTYYWTRNWLMTLAKHSAPMRAWAYAGTWILRQLLVWTFLPKWRSKRDHRDAVARGLLDFLRGRSGMYQA